LRDKKSFSGKKHKKIVESVQGWKGSLDMNEVVKVLSTFMTTPSMSTAERIDAGYLEKDGVTETEKGRMEKLAKVQDSKEMKEYNQLMKKIKAKETKEKDMKLMQEADEIEELEKEQNRQQRLQFNKKN